MEELQDALEDAQYVNAINLDGGPRPITGWEVPSEKEMEVWKSGLLKKWLDNPNKDCVAEPFTYEWALSYSLGFFMFSAFIKETSDDYVQINFIEDLIRWRKLPYQSGGSTLRKIYERYFLPCELDVETRKPKKPKLKHIEECDLEYDLKGANISKDALSKLVAEHRDDACRKCAIGITGPLYVEVVKTLEDFFTQVSVNTTVTDDTSVMSSASSSRENKDRQEGGVPSDDTSNNEKVSKSPQVTETKNNKPKASMRKSLSKRQGDLFGKIGVIVLEIIRLKHWSLFKQSPKWSKLMIYLWHKDRVVSDEDFFLMRVLGRGGFGLVTACKKGTTGTLYAMKVMNKVRIKAKKSTQLALNERACLAAVNSPFVVNLKYAFQTKDDLYLILDLMTGGDLSFHLSQKGRFPKEECLYYAARVMLGLQALHDKNYVYRDLKPENLLLAEDGRVRITDLGLATQVTPRLYGAAGTRGYWAPEMLRRNEKGKRMTYDQRVDWFSFGCVVAEMICGCNPFRSEGALKFGLSKASSKEKALDYATLNMEPSFESKKFTPTSTDLCKSLLEKDPNKRLGSNGCKEIMKHPWFDGVDWEIIISDKAVPPFQPLKDINAASQSKIGTFAEDKSAIKLTDDDHGVYVEWDWTSDRVFANEVIDMLIYEREAGRPLVPLSDNAGCCCN
eukprot:CAMPEP_0176499150 /NCGR_PEP_ID=MMETSP0200_2-20121128/12752_1 /TAXON_ID=947934 /ORGANISM="Chaetoceros sp., Strain GSL56" /LENGTH=674 /DNA_ID=CAMNT_0017897507 /DNA_START=81 /DNA_END=2102 /DNA_ORIENTATION=-